MLSRAPISAALRDTSCSSVVQPNKIDHQPYPVPGFVLRRGNRLPAWFKRHRRRSARDDNRRVLLHQRPGATAIFCASLPAGLPIVENVTEITEIQHPAVRAVLQWNGNSKGLEIHHDGDCRRAPAWLQLRVVHRWPDQRAESSGWAADLKEDSPTMRFTSSSASCVSLSDRRIDPAAFGGFNRISSGLMGLLICSRSSSHESGRKSSRKPSDAVLLRHFALLVRHRTDEGR